MILLDSNVLVEILEKRSKNGEELYNRIIESGETICTTSLNLHELLFGLKKYNKPVKELLQFPTIEYSKEDALLSSDIEYQMEKAGMPIRRTDSMIASIAIKKSISILTLDTNHFAPITKKFPLKLFKIAK
jgi:tRNA(fMet)-specific endonuclease VapC